MWKNYNHHGIKIEAQAYIFCGKSDLPISPRLFIVTVDFYAVQFRPKD